MLKAFTFQTFILLCVLFDSAQTILDKFETPRVGCSDLADRIWKISLLYFKIQTSITIVVDDDDWLEYEDLIKCSFPLNDIAVKIFILSSNETKLNFKENTHQDRQLYDNRIGYILLGRSQKSLLPKVAHIAESNILANVILVLKAYDITLNIFEVSWKHLRMINLMVFLMTPKKHLHYNQHFLLSGFHVQASVYNPFEVKNETRGVVHTHRVHSHNVYQVVNYLAPIISSRLWNFHKYPVKVCVFELDGVMEAIYDQNNTIIDFKGFDAMISKMFFRQINLTPEYVQPSAGSGFGTRTKNGSFTGMFGVMEKEEADISINICAVKGYKLKNSTFLYPINEMVYRFIVPKLGYKSRVYYFNILGWGTSSMIISAYILLISSGKVLFSVYTKYVNTENVPIYSLGRQCIVTLATFLMISQNSPGHHFERCLFMGSLFFGLVIGCCYQGTMVKMLTSSMESLDVDLLSDIAESKWKILIDYSLKDHVSKYDHSEVNKVYKKLYESASFVHNYTESVRKVAEDRDSAFLMYDVVLEHYRYKLYSKKISRNLLHKALQIFTKSNGAYLIAKACPYKQRFDEILLRMVESGLVAQEKKNHLYSLHLDVLKNPRKTLPSKKLFTMSELWFIFMSLGISLFISCLVFGMELSMKRKIKQNGVK